MLYLNISAWLEEFYEWKKKEKRKEKEREYFVYIAEICHEIKNTVQFLLLLNKIITFQISFENCSYFTTDFSSAERIKYPGAVILMSYLRNFYKLWRLKYENIQDYFFVIHCCQNRTLRLRCLPAKNINNIIVLLFYNISGEYITI